MKMNALIYKDYVARITLDTDAKVFHGRVLGMKDVLSFRGKTVEELEQAFHETVDEYLAWCKEDSTEPQKTWAGKMSLRFDDDLRHRVGMAAALEGVSINKWLEKVADHAARQVLAHG